MKTIKYNDSDVVFYEGTKNDCLYKVLSGSFALYINYGQEDEFLVGVVSKGKCFGEIGFLTDENSPYTVVANEESLVLSVEMDRFNEFIINNPANVVDIMKSMGAQTRLYQKHVEMLMDELIDKKEKDVYRNKLLQEQLSKYRTFLR